MTVLWCELGTDLRGLNADNADIIVTVVVGDKLRRYEREIIDEL